MLAAMVGYCIWLWLLTLTGVVESGTSSTVAATLLFLPLLPVAAFDLWLRLTWEQEYPALYPSPPTLTERLFQRKYGLYWFPILICLPLWVWAAGYIGLAVFTWLKGLS